MAEGDVKLVTITGADDVNSANVWSPSGNNRYLIKNILSNDLQWMEFVENGNTAGFVASVHGSNPLSGKWKALKGTMLDSSTTLKMINYNGYTNSSRSALITLLQISDSNLNHEKITRIYRGNTTPYTPDAGKKYRIVSAVVNTTQVQLGRSVSNVLKNGSTQSVIDYQNTYVYSRYLNQSLEGVVLDENSYIRTKSSGNRMWLTLLEV